MKEIIAVIVVASVLLLAMPAGGIRISSIDDAYIGKEVTVSGVVVTTSSNVETSNVHTYEPRDTSVLTIDDGSGKMRVCGDERLFSFQQGVRILVRGIYAGEDIIYADTVSTYVEHGYKNLSVAELKGFSEYYYDHSVRVEGVVKRIELTPGRTKLRVEDATGTIDVEYRREVGDIKLNEEVIVEGKFWRDMIYAVSVRANETAPSSNEHSEAPGLVSSSPEASTPTPVPTPTPTPVPTPTPTPTPTLTSNNGAPSLLYLLLLGATVIIVGLLGFLMIRQRKG